jgi:Family of unknown function (DUF5715)
MMKVQNLTGRLFSGQAIISAPPRSGMRWNVVAPLVAGLLLSIPSFAAVQTTQPHKTHHKTSTASATSAASYKHRSRYAKWSPMFPGSHDKLVEQNAELDRSEVPRMNSEFQLVESEMSNDLVQVNETEALKVADNLMDTRRYCRPWTRDFLNDLSQAYYETFHTALQVNSLVRTADQQAWLRRHNRFAAPATGDTASTHLAGVAVDLSRRGLTTTQYQWIRGYLQPLQQHGMVDPIEERQPVLHVVVFEKYSGKYLQPRSNSEASEATELDLLGHSGSQP